MVMVMMMKCLEIMLLRMQFSVLLRLNVTKVNCRTIQVFCVFLICKL